MYFGKTDKKNIFSTLIILKPNKLLYRSTVVYLMNDTHKGTEATETQPSPNVSRDSGDKYKGWPRAHLWSTRVKHENAATSANCSNGLITCSYYP